MRTFGTIFTIIFAFYSGHAIASQETEIGLVKIPTKLNFTLNDVLEGTYHRDPDGRLKDVEKRPFQKVLHPEVLGHFKSYLEMMFRPDFPAPVHTLDFVVGGFDCLYERLEFATEEAKGDDSIRKESHREEVDKTLAFHKDMLDSKAITEEEKSLVSLIVGFGCDACRKAAEIAYGIGGHLTEPHGK